MARKSNQKVKKRDEGEEEVKSHNDIYFIIEIV